MTIDASIIAGLRTAPPLQAPDPLEQYSKSLALKNLLMQSDQAQRGVDDENAIREAYKQAGGDSKALRGLLQGGGQYRQLQALDKLDLENAGKRASIGKDEAATAKSKYDVYIDKIQRRSSILSTATDQASWEAARRTLALSARDEEEKSEAAQVPPQFDPVLLKAKLAEGQTIVQKLSDERAREQNAQKTANDPFTSGQDGKPVANPAVQAFQLDKAKKGAANVNVKTDVKTGESLAGQVGPMMKDSTSIAEGAVKQVDAAQRIVQAADNGKLFAGPGSDKLLVVSQVGQILGVGGKDDAEKISNTRAAIRGLAELTLQGRQQMKGQGAITESEGKLAERAMSGDIEKLTVPEIKQLAMASERAARFNYGEHSRKMKVMQENPALNQIAPFYQGPSMPAERPSKQAAGGGIKFLGFEGAQP